MIDHTNLFQRKISLPKKLNHGSVFVSSLSSKENRESFNNMLNDCYKYTDAINAKG